MILRILKKIKRFLIKKAKGAKVFFLEVPEPKRVRKVSEALKRENAKLRAEIKKLQEQNKKLKEKLKGKEKKEKEELEKRAREIKEKFEREEEEKMERILFKFPNINKPEICSVIKGERFDGPDGKYKYLKGIDLKDSDRGPMVYFLLETDDGETGRLSAGSLLNLPNRLSNPWSFINDLRFGKVKVNISPDGTLLPRKEKIRVSDKKEKGEKKK